MQKMPVKETGNKFPVNKLSRPAGRDFAGVGHQAFFVVLAFLYGKPCGRDGSGQPAAGSACEARQGRATREPLPGRWLNGAAGEDYKRTARESLCAGPPEKKNTGDLLRFQRIFQRFHQDAFGFYADKLFEGFPVFKNNDGGDVADAQPGGYALVVLDIQFANFCFVADFFSDFADHRPLNFTGRAPFGPEIHQADPFGYLFFKGGIGQDNEFVAHRGFRHGGHQLVAAVKGENECSEKYAENDPEVGIH